MQPTYLVIKETYSFVQCTGCGGVGHKTRTFQNQKFKEVCTRCNGKKLEKITRRTEVPLSEALKILEI